MSLLQQPTIPTSWTVAESDNSASFRYLEPHEHAAWDALVAQSPHGSVFCKSWWLNAVGDCRLLAYFSGKEIIAGVPLFFERRYGIKICCMPRLTPTWGVVMQSTTGKAATIAARETKILRAFARVLSGLGPFFQSFHPNLTNWLPFYWSGFRQMTRYTYVIDDLSNLSRVWDGMSSTTRTQIQKAKRAGLECVPCEIQDVYRCEYQSHLRHGKPPAHSESILRKLYDAARSNDCGACFGMTDKSGRVHSAWFLVWDDKRAYQLVGGIADETRSTGANSLGVWSTIQFAAERTRTYDFAGSMLEGVEKFNRGFGARQVPYNFIMNIRPSIHFCLRLAGKL